MNLPIKTKSRQPLKCPILMKVFFTLIFINIFLFSFCKVQEKKTETLLADLKFEKKEGAKALAYVKGQLFTGKAVSYYKNGEKFTEKNYVKGEEVGEWAIFFDNGDKKKVGFIKNGQPDGIS